MEISDETPVKKPKQLTSVVWNHFDRIRKSDMCYAICVHCNKKLSGSSNSGTTHLRNHLMRCLKRSNYDVSQILTGKRRKKDSAITLTTVGYDDVQRKEDCLRQTPIKYDHEIKCEGIVHVGSSKFDLDRSRLDLARMIILHGYPLAMVDHVGFKVFVKNLQPLCDFSSNSAVELYCMEMYGRGKENVREALHSMQGRINLAVEMWSSEEHAEYLSLTARYIDEDWKLQKKMLNFATLDSCHSGDVLSEIIINSIREWNIDCRLFSVTLDDCSMDDVVVKVRERLSETRPHLGSYQLLDVRSAAHVLDYIVHDTVDAFQVVTQKIRGSIKYVKSSRMVQEKMNEFSLQVGIDNSCCLVLDCPVRWKSTYQMVRAALEYRCAFSLLKEHDPSYTSDLSETEWDWASTICGYVKVICEVSNVLSSFKSPTANIYFPEMCHVHVQLIEWCKVPDEFVSAIALKMKEKFDRYWSKCGLLLAVAVILDPRFKMKLVEYYYSHIYGSTAPDRIKEVYDAIRELFSSYSMCSSLVDQGSAFYGNVGPDTSNGFRDRLMGFDKFLHETAQGESASSDLEKYLEEPIFPRSCDFNILNWWKVHTARYPLLAMMARDILGTPMSNAAPDSDCSGRILDSSRSTLDPDIRQALICTRHWLQTESEELKSSASHSVISLCVEPS